MTYSASLDGRLSHPSYSSLLLATALTFLAGCSGSSSPDPQPFDSDSEVAVDCPTTLPSPVVSYSFNGNADDSSGTGNHGTVNGALLVEDRFGNPESAYWFDGVDDVITIGPGGQAPFPLTISLWFSAEDFRFAQVFSNDDTNDAGIRSGIGMLVSSTVAGDSLEATVGANIYQGFSSAANRTTYRTTDGDLYTQNTWHHFLIVFNENRDREIYFDGRPKPGLYLGSGSSMVYGGGNGMIGRMHGNSVPKFQFLGVLDDIQVFNQALTPEQVATLFTIKADCV